MGCLLSFFYQTPSVTAAIIEVDSASLAISGAQEAILNIVQQALNAVFPAVVGLLITAIEGLVVFGLNAAIEFGVGLVPIGCPARRLGAPAAASESQ